ncbi:hypothetical protein ACX3V1_14420, partial [Escherichia coli]
MRALLAAGSCAACRRTRKAIWSAIFPGPADASLPHSRERVRALFKRASPGLVPARIYESPGPGSYTHLRAHETSQDLG